MPYEKSWTDTQGGTQTLKTIGNMVIIEGPGPGGGGAVSCMFDASQFRSASIETDFGKVTVQAGHDETGVWFGAHRDVAFTLADILEAVQAAKAEA